MRNAWGWERWALLALIALAFALRLADVNAPSIWHDEAWSIRAIRDPVGTPDDNTPPLYYALGHLLWLGAGETPLALRYSSVLLGTLTVALGAWLAGRWGGQRAALVAAALLSVSPLLWAYAREIRAYVAVPLWTLTLLALADALSAPDARSPRPRLAPRGSYRHGSRGAQGQRPRPRAHVWAALWACELALLYTHNLSVPVIAWLNVALGGVWLWRRDWRRLALWLGTQIALGVAYLPWVLGQSPSGTPLNTPPSLGPAQWWRVWQGYYAPLPTLVGAKAPLVWGSAALAVLTAWAAWRVARRRTRWAWLLLSQALLLPPLATLMLLAAHIDFHPRYYIAGAPAALLVLALGFAGTPSPRARPRRSALRAFRRAAFPALGGGAALALSVGVGAVSLHALRSEPRYGHDDFRAVAAYYATLPADALIVVPYGWEPALEVYYAPKLGVRAEILGVPLHSDEATALAALRDALGRRTLPAHVELLTWYQLPADLRGMYPCLLGAAGEQVGALTVQGVTTTAYRVERLPALARLPDAGADYGALTLTGAAQSADGGGALCVRTDWRLARSTAEDWRVSARLLAEDPADWQVAQSEADIRRPDQTPTSAWAVGAQGAAYNVLRLPDGAPPQNYRVQIVLFSAQTPHGLDRLREGVPAGRTLPLGVATLRGRTPDAQEFAPPRPQRIALGADVTLLGHDAAPQTLDAGQTLRVTLYWQADARYTARAWQGAALVLRGADWEVRRTVRAYGPRSLDWHALRVPPEAQGDAELLLEAADGATWPLSAYRVRQSAHQFTPPPYDVALGTEFVGVGVLEGVSVGAQTVTPDAGLELTLVWRALGATETPYRVFTHLLDADGRVIAQHDGMPAAEQRPTTGWVADEYIVDVHVLRFDPERADYRGPARLEVGLYDPQTGARVPVRGGGDHVVLPPEITVSGP